MTITLDGINGAVPDVIAPVDLAPADPSVVMGLTDANGQFSVTFTSLTGGLVTGSATSNVDVAGLVLPRTTDGSETVVGSGTFNSGPAVKRWVDAKIIIEPDDVNEVGDDHTFTATVFVDDGTGTDVDGVMGNFDAVGAGEDVTISLLDSNGAVSVPAGPLAGLTDANGQFSVTFTSLTGGLVTGSATSNVDVAGLVLTRTTDGSETVVGSGTFNSGPAEKLWVDAKIIIEPDDTNRVGEDHTFTATVFVDDGTGTDADGVMGNFDAVGAGEDVTISLLDSNGAVNVPAGPLAGLTDANGQFSVTFTSFSGGLVTGTATSNVDVAGLVLTRTTDGSETVVGSGTFNSDGAVKKFVDAKIFIDPDGVNLVGDPHTFTATYFVDDGTGTDADGVMGNFDAFAGANVNIALNDAGGAVSVPAGALNGVTDANGQFSVTFTSFTTGTTTGVATAGTSIDGVDLTESTDGSETVIGSGVFNGDPALKQWIDVDAKITITPDDTNEVGDDHTFTITVWEDDGMMTDVDGEMGFFDRAANETVTVDLTDLFGANNNLGPQVIGVTDANGEFTVTFTSLTGGLVIGSASSDVDVNGTIVSVATDGVGNNSGPAEKLFVDAKIIIEPDDVNAVGEDHTFTATVFVDDGTGTDADGVMGNFDAVGAGRRCGDHTVGFERCGERTGRPAGGSDRCQRSVQRNVHLRDSRSGNGHGDVRRGCSGLGADAYDRR